MGRRKRDRKKRESFRGEEEVIGEGKGYKGRGEGAGYLLGGEKGGG